MISFLLLLLSRTALLTELSLQVVVSTLFIMFLWLVRSGEKKEKGEREERGADYRPDRPDQTRRRFGVGGSCPDEADEDLLW